MLKFTTPTLGLLCLIFTLFSACVSVEKISDRRGIIKIDELIEGNEGRLDPTGIIREALKKGDAQIAINQLGYKPKALKIFFVNRESNRFALYKKSGADPSADSIVLEGDLTELGEDVPTGDFMYRGDISGVTEEGEYYLVVKSLDGEKITSGDFKIGKNVYDEALYHSLRFFTYQRCGVTLDLPYLKRDRACHTEDGTLLSDEKTKHESLYGWHDAGDFGKYVVNAGISIGSLLLAYELNPSKFYDGQFDLPNDESSNGIPDILDEVKFETDWVLTMQREDGGVWHKLTPKSFTSPKTDPQDDPAIRFIIDNSLDRETGKNLIGVYTSTATADFVAMLAMMSRVIRAYDPAYADKLLAAAVKSWNFLEKNPKNFPDRGFANPTGVSTGEYQDDPTGGFQSGQGGDKDERFWAACEMFKTTGESKYHDYIKANYNFWKNRMMAPANWYQVQNLGFFTYLLTEKADSGLKSLFLNELNKSVENILKKTTENGYQVALAGGEYYWGSNSVLTNYVMNLVVSHYLTKDQDTYDKALDQLHYLFGRNSLNLSFVTLIGSNFAQHPWHWLYIRHNTYFPGALVGGPNKDHVHNDEVLNQRINLGLPPAKCYVDVSIPGKGSWGCNEVAINWNAPLVLLLSYFKD